MAFTSLRKSEQDPESDLGYEDLDEVPDIGDEEVEPALVQISLFQAPFLGVHGWWTWCADRIGVGGTWTLHGVAMWAAGYYTAWVTCSVTAGFLLAVGLFTPREPLDRLAARIEALTKPHLAEPEPATNTPGGAPGDPLVVVLWKLIGDASGVHLKTLTQVLARAAEGEGNRPPAKDEVEATLEARGIPLRASVRDAREKVNRGVHREDLKAWEEALSQVEPAAPDPGP